VTTKSLTRAVLTAALLTLTAAAHAQVAPKIFSFYAQSEDEANCTVQKPSAQTSARTDFLSGTFYCEAACTIELELGTATATDTNGDIVAMTHGDSENEAFCESEATQGDQVYVYTLAAGEEKSISLRGVVWPATTGGRTLTLRTSTGMSRRNITWMESP
jgi:hypothetical protein